MIRTRHCASWSAQASESAPTATGGKPSTTTVTPFRRAASRTANTAASTTLRTEMRRSSSRMAPSSARLRLSTSLSAAVIVSDAASIIGSTESASAGFSSPALT